MILVAVGSALVLLEGTGWMMDRFTMFWWTVQTVQITAVLVGFWLIIRRVAKLEEETTRLRQRVEAIREFCARSLGFEGKPDEEDERMLRSVS